MLEPCAGKLASTVLRGEGSREASNLPDAISPMRAYCVCTDRWGDMRKSKEKIAPHKKEA